MKWINKDLEQYVQAKEYVDTIIVPLIPFHLSRDDVSRGDALQSEVLSLFIRELEKELTGRIMLVPDYTYLRSADKNSELERIGTWIDDIQRQPFHHVFFISSDSSWKKFEQALQGTFIWMPAITSDSIQSKETQSAIKHQVQQVSELIRSFWNDDQ